MIITKQKSLPDILEYLKDAKKVFLVGCTLCATTCKTGGAREIEVMKGILEKEGKIVKGAAILDPACSLLQVKRLYRNNASDLDDSDAILSLVCGGGTQALAQFTRNKLRIFPANDTLFQGEITEVSIKKAHFVQRCVLCGECVLGETGAICPMTRCPKSLRNGPCGGVKGGKCEVSSELDCAWHLIYNKLKEFGQVEKMRAIFPSKDHSKNRSPRELVI